jgi:hypothetical protein
MIFSFTPPTKHKNTMKINKNTKCTHTEIPLDRISRDVALWMRAIQRLRSARLLEKSQPFRLFIQAS